MTNRLPQASALLLALVATLATLGGIDRLAAAPTEASWAAQALNGPLPVKELAAVDAPVQRIVVTAPNYQRVVVVARRTQA